VGPLALDGWPIGPALPIPPRDRRARAYGAVVPKHQDFRGKRMSTTEMTSQAGWYAVGGGHERYWDGSAWTDELRPVPAYVGVVVPDGRLLSSV
jgi:hypothetical protein